MTEQAGLKGLRPHDLRHHAITSLAESLASEQTIMAIAGHVFREMLEHYRHIRLEAKRKALDSLDNVHSWHKCSKERSPLENSKPANVLTVLMLNWSGRADLNCRPLAPQASALPG